MLERCGQSQEGGRNHGGYFLFCSILTTVFMLSQAFHGSLWFCLLIPINQLLQLSKDPQCQISYVLVMQETYEYTRRSLLNRNTRYNSEIRRSFNFIYQLVVGKSNRHSFDRSVPLFFFLQARFAIYGEILTVLENVGTSRFVLKEAGPVDNS